MRKVISLLLVTLMVFAMAACSSDTGNSSTAQNSSAAQDSSVAEESSAAEESAAEESSVADESSAAEDSSAAEESSAADAQAEVMSYEEYVAAELDSEVCVETYVQAKQSYYAEQQTATLYTQDEDGAYFVYDASISQEDYDKLEPGTKIRVTGYKSEWSGEVEIIDGTVEVLDSEDTFVAEALDVTDLLGTDELIDHQNQFVSFKGLEVVASIDEANGNAEVPFLYNYNGSGSEGDDLYFNVSKDGETYTFVIESYLCDSTTEVYQAVQNLAIGDVIDMEGYLYWYEGVNPHIVSVTPAA